MITDEDIPAKLHSWLEAQSKESLIELMYDALGLMQQYNGRSLTYCICKAAGFEELAFKNNPRLKWRGTIKQLKEYEE